jgi:hypothetical protein
MTRCIVSTMVALRMRSELVINKKCEGYGSAWHTIIFVNDYTGKALPSVKSDGIDFHFLLFPAFPQVTITYKHSWDKTTSEQNIHVLICLLDFLSCLATRQAPGENIKICLNNRVL